MKCVKRGEWTYSYEEGPGPGYGTVWTVLYVNNDPDPFAPPGDYLALVEWPKTRRLFHSSRFIPLDGNEDISVFTSMLTRLPAIHKEPAIV